MVLVHGSGGHDRDETIGPNKPFQDIAWGLASKGIAVLRYDKRTFVYPQELVAQIESLTIYDETIDDAKAAVDLLQKTERIDASRLFVAGHSLGGSMAPVIAVEHDGVAGLVIMAGASRPLEELVLEQNLYLAAVDGTISAQEQEQIAQVEALVEKIMALDFEPGETVLGGAKAYWESLTTLRPVEVVAELSIPMLVLQGGRDYQVTMEDFNGWRQALGGHSNVVFREYPSLNHLFIPGTGTPSPQEYGTHGSVLEDVIRDIAEWIYGQ